MVKYAMDVYKELHETKDVPPEMEQLVEKHLKTLRDLRERKFLQLFEEPCEVPKRLYEEDHWNLTYLKEHHQVTDDDVQALHDLAKFYYECGDYGEAADLLHYYRLLVSDPLKKKQRNLGSIWIRYFSFQLAKSPR
jgi:translation initiation factor 3 subunit E